MTESEIHARLAASKSPFDAELLRLLDGKNMEISRLNKALNWTVQSLKDLRALLANKETT